MKRMCEESKRLRSQAAIGVDERNEGKKNNEHRNQPKKASSLSMHFTLS